MTCSCPAAEDGGKPKPRIRKSSTSTAANGVMMKEESGGTGRGKSRGKEDEHMLVGYEELPDYMKENEYIRRYYRAEWPLKHAFLSLFQWHNETLNVWTHLVGFLLFVALSALHLRDVPAVAELLINNWNINWSGAMTAAETNVSKDGIRIVVNYGSGADTGGAAGGEGVPRWPVTVFMCGSMFCLLCSSVCHLFCCHSRRLSLLLWRMDYVGIAIMIVTSFFPPIYYIFLCQPHWQLLYLASISLIGLATAVTLFSPQFSTAPFRVYRAVLFLAMGLSGLVPAVHAAVVNWDDPQRPVTLAWESAMAVLYVTGTAFYISRVPERWKPGFFDLTGHSHQIFHAFVLAGALAHYAAALLLLQWRDSCMCAPDITVH